MVVDLILQALLTDLIKALKLIEIDGIAIRHNHAVKFDSQAALLTETIGPDLPRFPQHDRSFRDEDVLMIMRVHRIRNKHLDWPHRIAVKSVHQNGIHGCPFIDDVGLAHQPSRCLPQDRV